MSTTPPIPPIPSGQPKPVIDLSLQSILAGTTVQEAVTTICMVMAEMTRKAAMQERERAAKHVEASRGPGMDDGKLAELLAKIRSGVPV